MKIKNNNKNNEIHKQIFKEIKEIKDTKMLVFVYNFIKELKIDGN